MFNFPMSSLFNDEEKKFANRFADINSALDSLIEDCEAERRQTVGDERYTENSSIVADYLRKTKTTLRTAYESWEVGEDLVEYLG